MHSNRENDERSRQPAASPGEVARLLERVAGDYASLTNVIAVALAGSLGGALGSDPHSDVDLYVYRTGDVPLGERLRIASRDGTAIEVGNTFWEDGDEWLARSPPIRVDVMMRSVQWIEDEVERALTRHEARLGYSTCFVYNLQNSAILADPTGWLARLKARASAPYPTLLRDAILAKNHPVLRNAHSAYAHQIAAAAARGDLVSLDHRVAALLASYFDIVVAVNLRTHPGEKRLVQFVSNHCESKPARFEQAVGAVLVAAAGHPGAIADAVTQLIDGLDAWLDGHSLLPPWPRGFRG